MEIDSKSKSCPVCNYQFAEQSGWLKWGALALAILFLLYIILF
jgi:hypothetical protein